MDSWVSSIIKLNNNKKQANGDSAENTFIRNITSSFVLHWENVFFYFKIEITTLIILYILTKITWYLPTWFLFVTFGELYVFWDILKENAVIDRIHYYVELAK